MDEIDVEYKLLTKQEVNIYQIPPQTMASGYKADDWIKCIWQGRLVVSARKTNLYVRLMEATKDELFKQVVIVNGRHEDVVERTIDSSRCFVLKLVDEKTRRKQYVGLGFADRNDAFDFNSCLNDFKTRNDVKPTCAFNVPCRDLSLQKGEKLKLDADFAKKVASSRKGEGRDHRYSSSSFVDTGNGISSSSSNLDKTELGGGRGSKAPPSPSFGGKGLGILPPPPTNSRRRQASHSSPPPPIKGSASPPARVQSNRADEQLLDFDLISSVDVEKISSKSGGLTDGFEAENDISFASLETGLKNLDLNVGLSEHVSSTSGPSGP